MKVGDWVRVKEEHLAYWPEGADTTVRVLAMDEQGVKVGGLFAVTRVQGDGEWIAKNVFEVIPQEDSMGPQALRYNEGKPELSYVLTFGEALRAMAQVSTCGAAKYDRGNYLKGAPLSQSADCLLRHLLAWWEGEDTDPESGQGHLAHVVWNALRLCQESIVRPDLDDRISYPKDLPDARTAP